ncbi:MAG: hypothetical protein H6704_29140 [Myxococcales bacterium]|nr:hypothetical protein [Myxococcales bacterium]
MRVGWLLLVMLATGCAADAPATDDPVEDGGVGDAARDTPDVGDTDAGAPVGDFAGWWLVDQPTHALYEATLYHLGTNGAVADPLALDTGSFEAGFVTGVVARGETACRFGRAWRAPEAALLVVDGVCDDGVDRPIALRFPAPPGPAADVWEVVVETVAGEAGWTHPGPDWRFLRCASLGECLGAAPLAQRLEIELLSATFAFCRCHHGFGPGLDGDLRLRVRNTSEAPATVGGWLLALRGADGAPILVQSDTPHRARLDPPAAWDDVVAPGQTLDLRISVYHDGDASLLRPGRYTGTFALRASGAWHTVDIGAVEVGLAEE